MRELIIFINVLPESIKIGLIYSIMVMGVYITYKILDFPDLTVDGSFPLGGFVYAAFALSPVAYINSPLFALIMSLVAGALAGLMTGIFHVHFGIDKLLSGILTMTALYSINARIVGKPSIFIPAEFTLYGRLSYEHSFIYLTIGFVILFAIKLIYDYNIKLNKYVIMTAITYVVLFAGLMYYVVKTQDIIMYITIFIVYIIKIIMDYILTSKFGFILRALGDNEQLVVNLGINEKRLKIAGLMLANGLVALSGALFTQFIKVIDLSSSVGTIVIGLAAIIFGIGLVKKNPAINYITIVIIGSVVYYIIINLALNSNNLTNLLFNSLHLPSDLISKLNIKPTDVKLITAVLLSVVLGIDHIKKKKIKKVK